ncbi:hypothetical protein CU098_011371 [Rhizopus stolonifer]|uniref:Uncharacterized protein n=1 Tax=Rhizopus stolonifer TaxID=4846 RepID=A0A367JZX6_RHIST|nr:hypothetical protein CU098_011371 [Rhizopus stolonifer]
MNCNLVYEYDQVDWLDTDASEDEDYLPQFPRQEKEEFPIVPSIEKYNQQKYCIEHTSSISSISSISEDDVDDFSDRKRGRMNSMSWDTNDTRRKKKSNETPLSKVRKAIDNVVDNGIEQVDISNIELEDIPDEIGELAYVTVLHNDIVKSASLQLFLYNNRIHTLSPVLFRLKNLTVLSLRKFISI